MFNARVNWRLFLGRRRLTFIALLSTILVLVTFSSLVPGEAAILQKDYAIDPSRMQALYLVLTAVLLIAFACEPAIRSELADGKGTALIIGVAGAVSFAIFQSIVPGQELRLFHQSLGLWLVVCHLVALCSLAVVMVTDNPFEPATRRLRRYGIVVLLVLGAAMVAVHVLSLGRFMQLDLPDEPLWGSNATNYAEHGLISSSVGAVPFYLGNSYSPRYYVVMGLWVRLAGSSLIALRAFPLIIAGLAVLLTAIALWRIPGLTRLQQLAGIVALLAFSPFLRTSHNLRMDIGLAVYGSLILFGLISYLYHPRRSLWWLAFLGGANYIGLEVIPTAAAPMGIALGLMIVALSLRKPLKHSQWKAIVVYAGMSAVALVIFGIVHFAPNFSEEFGKYKLGLATYHVGTFFRSPIAIFGYFTRFSMMLAPAELILIILALVILLRSGVTADRVILGTAGLAAILLTSWTTTTYGYLTLFAPFVAYLIARACHRRIDVSIGVFVLLPALLSMPFHDMATEINLDLNNRTLREAELLTWQIPEGTNILGEDIFWFTLHQKRNFVDWDGFSNYQFIKHMDVREALESLNIDIGICTKGSSRCSQLTDSGLFDPPVDFDVTEKYFIYKRHSSPTGPVSRGQDGSWGMGDAGDASAGG